MPEIEPCYGRPVNQRIIHDLVDELAIYAYEMTVSQADVPYAVQPGLRPAGSRKLSLYVDELTIDGDLVNPARISRSSPG